MPPKCVRTFHSRRPLPLDRIPESGELSVTAAARTMGLSARWVRELIRRGKLTLTKCSGPKKRRVSAASVREYLENSEGLSQ